MHSPWLPSLLSAVAVGSWLLPSTAAAQVPLLRQLEQRLRDTIDAQTLPPPLPTPPPAAADRPPRLDGPPRLGVVVQDISLEAIRRNQLAVRRGALITTIEAGSPADRAGLPLGGVIVSFDGVRIDSSNELIAMVRSSRPGQTVEIGYYDGQRLFRKRVDLTPSPPNVARRPPGQQYEDLPAPGDASTPAGSERPLLDTLGRVLDGIAAPNSARPPVTVLGDPRRADLEVVQLRKQVETLAARIEQLTERIDQLESRLGSQQ